MIPGTFNKRAEVTVSILINRIRPRAEFVMMMMIIMILFI
jgi:hypothetical protein